MSRRRKARGKTLDVVQRLQQRVAEGDYYEALQLYKTSYSRFKAQQKLDDGDELLVTGAIAMCRENELNAATELGLLIVTSFEENDRACDETRLAQLKRVAEAMTPGVEMSEFLKRAIRWTSNSQEKGAHELRLIMARSLLTIGRLGDAARYFAISGRPDEYASLIHQWSSKGYPGERDMFLCRAVLHTLSCNRMDDAAVLFKLVGDALLAKEDRSGGAETVLDSPLCHFTSFVLELCQAKSEAGAPSCEMVNTFQGLRKAYQDSLDRDPHFDEMLDRIGHVHFGIKPARPEGLMGMIGQLMGGM